jgi:hypothetical protein
MALVISASIAAAAVVAVAAPVVAHDASCTRVTFYNSKGHTTYVLQSGVGLVGWRTSMSMTAYDRCSHGDLAIQVGVNNANVVQKGGKVVVTKVQYRRTGSSTWYSTSLSACTTTTSCRWNVGGHLDLTPSWRVTYIRLYTYVVFNGVGSGGRYHTCNIVYGNCS